MQNIRVLHVENEPVWRRKVSSHLENEKDILIVGQSNSRKGGMSIARRSKVDVVIVDLFLNHHSDGIDDIFEINGFCQDRIIVFTEFDKEEFIFGAFQAGAVDYIMKSQIGELPVAIRAAYKGESPIRPEIATKIRKEFCRLRNLEGKFQKIERLKMAITPTEIEILKLIDLGMTLSEIAGELYITVKTVKNHITHILQKTGETSRENAAKKAKEWGIIGSPIKK